MSNLIYRSPEVIKTQQLSPNMRRITLGGEQLRGFDSDFVSGYIKLYFNADTLKAIDDLHLAPEQNPKPLKRTYTIRHLSQEQLRLDIDFVVHGDSGPASKWASHVTVGQRISISGPGISKVPNNDADWFLLAGDMPALPALSVALESLPRSAKGYCVVEVMTDADEQSTTGAEALINKPEGMELIWLISGTTTLLEHINALTWLNTNVAVWIACEFSKMRAIRAFLLEQKSVTKAQMYISSYWKEGLNEDQHKVVKRSDAERINHSADPK